MRFVIEVPDELLRGVTGAAAAESAPGPAQSAPLSGGPAADAPGPGTGGLAETLSAGPAEGGGVPASLGDSLGDGAMARNGGAAPA